MLSYSNISIIILFRISFFIPHSSRKILLLKRMTTTKKTTTTTQKGHHPGLVDVFFDDDGESSRRRPISFVSSLKKVDLGVVGDDDNTPAKNDDDESSPECVGLFFPRFDDELETFSLDALVVVNNNHHRQTKNVVFLERYATNPDLVSKPKAIVYDDWYARAKEALTTNDFSNLSTKKGHNTKYAFTLEEKKKKKKEDDDAFSPFELVWRFSTTTTTTNNKSSDYNGKTFQEEKGDDDGKMLMMRGSCKMKRVGAATAEDERSALELLKYSSMRYIREKERNIDLERANECLRKDQESAVQKESEKAREMDQFKKKCLEECLVLVNEKKKRIRELEEILETAKKENDALTRRVRKKGKKKGGRRTSPSSSSSSEEEDDDDENDDEEDYSSDESGEEEEEEEANTDDEDKDTQVRKRMRRSIDANKNTNRRKPPSKTTTKAATTAGSQKSKRPAPRINTFDALMQANLGEDSDVNSRSSSF